MARGLIIRALLAVALTASAGATARTLAYAASADTVLGGFVRAYGDPPQATEGRLRIPAIDVDAPIAARDVSPDGDSPMPLGPSDVAWYRFGPYAGLGGVPGEGRNAVFSGHVDYVARVPWAGTRYSGPGVFARLGELKPGDPIEVMRDGQVLRYVVSWALHVDAAEARWGEYWNAAVPVDSITLYTCAGQFDAASISYSDRVVVRAERIVGNPRKVTMTFGDYAVGSPGTTSLAAFASVQPFPVQAVWKYDPALATFRFWAPGLPTFMDTLTGHVGPEDTLIIKIR